MSATFQLRRDTVANWITHDPIPRAGEPCVNTDTGEMKIGDGTSKWSELRYITYTELAEDLSPVLAGNLDCGNYNITLNNKPLILKTSGGTYQTSISVGANDSNLAFTLPASYGTAGMLIQSNGTGALTFDWKYEYINRDSLGTLAIGDLMYFVAPRDLVITEVKMFVKTRPAAGSVIVDVRQTINDTGHSILTGASMSVLSTANVAASGIYETIGTISGGSVSISEGQLVWFTVISPGTAGSEGTDLNIRLKYR
ncbi:MAG: hypothetical protein PHT13_00240 [Methanosarcina sp.]|nr:hypothetical protein [Methanosarcina sp.]